jgi:hypothetical protein
LVNSPDLLSEQIRQIFDRLARGQLSTSGPTLQSGWEMELPSGDVVVRSTLQTEAAPLIELGGEAVPYLLPWVEQDNLALRYVAVYSLQKITGLSPELAYFARDTGRAQRDAAVRVWREWFENRPRGQ